MRRLGGLTIRTRILAFQLVVGVAVLSLFAAAFVAIQNFHYYLARGALAHRQLAAVTNLARDADQYSKSIASLLMTGAPELQEIAALQGRIGAGFDALRRLTQEETDFLAARGLDQAQQVEFDRIDRLRELYDDMNRRYEALMAMRETGQGEAAARVFFRDVDRRLDEEFENLIDDAIAGEIDEVEAADGEAEQLVRILGWGIGVTSTLVLLATLLAGYFLYRSIVRPIRTAERRSGRHRPRRPLLPRRSARRGRAWSPRPPLRRDGRSHRGAAEAPARRPLQPGSGGSCAGRRSWKRQTRRCATATARASASSPTSAMSFARR